MTTLEWYESERKAASLAFAARPSTKNFVRVNEATMAAAAAAFQRRQFERLLGAGA